MRSLARIPGLMDRTWHLRAFCGLCLVNILVWVLYYGVDVLYRDEWIFWVRLLEHLDAGSLNLDALIAQHNEQRIAWTRLIGLADMHLFDLARMPEYLLNISLALGTFLGLAKLYSSTREKLGVKGRPGWVVAGFALLCFSTLQWANFTIGFNNQNFLPVLCVVLAMLLCTGQGPTILKIPALLGLGVLSSFNLSSGLLYWPVALFVVLFGPGRRHVRFLAATLVTALGVAVWVVYFTDFHKPPHHPALTDSLANPLRLAGYVFAYLGGPVSSDKNLVPLGLLLGLAAFCLFVAGAWRVRKGGRERFAALAPWLGLALFGLMCAGSTAVGRSGFGVRQALESRYCTFANTFWYALLPVLAAALAPAKSREKRWTHGFLCLSLAAFLLSTVLSLVIMHQFNQRQTKGRAQIFSLTNPGDLELIFPDPNWLMKNLPRFFARRLSVFRDVGQFQDYRIVPENVVQAGVLEDMEIIEGKDDTVSGALFSGTARDPSYGGPARYVLIVCRGRIIYVSGVQAVAPKPDGKDVGGRFEIFVPSSFFPNVEGVVEAYAISRDNTRAFRLKPARVFKPDLPRPHYPPFTVDKYYYSP